MNNSPIESTSSCVSTVHASPNKSSVNLSSHYTKENAFLALHKKVMNYFKPTKLRAPAYSSSFQRDILEDCEKKAASLDPTRNLFQLFIETYPKEETFSSEYQYVLDGIERVYTTLNKNIYIAGAPEEFTLRHDLYQKLLKGFTFVTAKIFERLDQNILTRDEAFECLKVIGDGGHHCLGRYRAVLEELFNGFNTQDEPSTTKHETPIEKTLKDIFFEARTLVSNHLSEQIFDERFIKRSVSFHVHYVNFFKQHLNTRHQFNLPITEEYDPLLSLQENLLTQQIENFLETKNLPALIVDKASALLSSQTKENYSVYEKVVDWATGYYHKHALHKQFEDPGEFLSEYIFDGFSRDLKYHATRQLMEDKGFIELLPAPKTSLAQHLYKSTLQGEWWSLDRLFREIPTEVKFSGYFHLQVKEFGNPVPVLNYLLNQRRFDIVEKALKMRTPIQFVIPPKTSFSKVTRESIIAASSPIHLVVLKGNVTLAKTFLDRGALPFSPLKVGNNFVIATPLEFAYASNRKDMIKLFVEYASNFCPNIPIRSKNGQIPLLSSLIRNTDSTFAKMLVHGNANPNVYEQSNFNNSSSSPHLPTTGRTPLHLCIQKNDSDLCSFLLEHGANPFSTRMHFHQEKSLNAFEYALESQNRTFLKQFLDFSKGTDLLTPYIDSNVKFESGTMPLLNYLIFHHENELAKKLIELGADVNQKETSSRFFRHIRDNEPVHDRTSLHMAVKARNTQIIGLLIINGANPHLTVSNGFFSRVTPAQYAFSEGLDNLYIKLKHYERNCPQKPTHCLTFQH